mgnify:FL=1
MSSAVISISGLSFAWPDDTPLFTELSMHVGAGRTGLVGANGTGKSTLLRLIAGELIPTGGAVTVVGRAGYLPQTLPYRADHTVADVLGVGPVLDALAALVRGDTRDEVFTAIGDDWDIEERTRAELDRLGLGHIGLDRRLGTLSGGEIVSLGLAGQLLARPDVLLLDEPTNNLDRQSRHRLYAALDEYPGSLLAVSHDRALLDRMDRIAELRDGEITVYGGNFSAYADAVREAQRAAQQQLRSAEQQLRRQRRERQQAQERMARRTRTAARNSKDAGLPRIVAGALRRSAQESAGRVDGVHAARIAAAADRLDEAERALRDDVLDPAEVDGLRLPDPAVPAGRTLVELRGVRVRHGGRRVLDGVDLTVRGPERIAVVGRNGTGKTTLLRVVSGDLLPDEGTLRRAAGRVAYLSQRLDLLDPHRTVAGSLAAAAPGLPHTRHRHLLARFGFDEQRIHLPVGALSGGERLRATLACVLFAEPVPRLLLLDEPTNNLDLAAVGQLQATLAGYRGALIVVSHDDRFLADIGVQRVLQLAGGRLTETDSA